jgi:hypothetical protein
MGTYENFYLNRIKQLQEENKQLRKVLNEARIRNEPLPERLGDERRDSRTVSSVSRSSSNISRNVDRDVEKMSILAALVDPNHEINKKENADEKASIIRVLGDMGMLKVEKKYEPGMSSRDYFFPSGKPAAEGGPGTGTANVEDMRTYIKATRPAAEGGFGYTSIYDNPNS